jgi:hypothetical protein
MGLENTENGWLARQRQKRHECSAYVADMNIERMAAPEMVDGLPRWLHCKW